MTRGGLETRVGPRLGKVGIRWSQWAWPDGSHSISHCPSVSFFARPANVAIEMDEADCSSRYRSEVTGLGP